MLLTTENIILIGALLLLVSVFAGKVAYRFGAPALLLFLGVGMLFGLRLISFNSAPVAQFVGMVALCIILFSGGMDTRYRAIRPVLGPGVVLATVGVALTALAIAAAGPFAYIFVGFDDSLFALTKHAFRLFSFSFLLAGFNIFCSGFFTALGNGAVSALISFLRVLVFQASSVIILPLFLDIDGIWWAITVSEVLAAIVSAVFLLAKRQRYHY